MFIIYFILFPFHSFAAFMHNTQAPIFIASKCWFDSPSFSIDQQFHKKIFQLSSSSHFSSHNLIFRCLCCFHFFTLCHCMHAMHVVHYFARNETLIETNFSPLIKTEETTRFKKKSYHCLFLLMENSDQFFCVVTSKFQNIKISCVSSLYLFCNCIHWQGNAGFFRFFVYFGYLLKSFEFLCANTNFSGIINEWKIIVQKMDKSDDKDWKLVKNCNVSWWCTVKTAIVYQTMNSFFNHCTAKLLHIPWCFFFSSVCSIMFECNLTIPCN